MKIRMGFVTNSSSSSFVAMLEATLDNGEQLTASAETSQGGEEGGWISTEPTDYEMNISQIAPMDDLARNIYNVEGQKRHIVSGSLRLMCHTYGEYAYEANPREMMSRYLGKVWGAVIDDIDTSLDQRKSYAKLREVTFLKNYTDDSLWSLIQYAYDEDYYPDTEIVHTLNRDGSLKLEIITGEGLFDTDDVFTTSWAGHSKGELSFQYDPERVQRRISITLGEDYYSGTEDEIQVIIQEHQKKYASFYSQMEKEAERSIAEYLAPNHFIHPNTMNFALANLDLNEVVSFQGKHFLISLNSKSIKFRQAVEREIKRRGGIPQALGYGELRRDTDYLVMSPHVSNFAALGSDVRRALEKKKEGYPVKIITEHQLWRGFMDPAIPVTSDEDAVGFIADKCKDNIDLKVALEAKMKKAEVYGYEDAFEAAVNHLDADAKIDFWDKHFVLSGFAETEGAFIDRIQTRGGIVHGKMVKKADYLVINMETPGTAKLREALMWRDSGSTCSIVSDYQLVQAFDRILPVDPEMLRQREKEAAQQKAEKQATAQRTVQEREQARRQRWEEKQRQAEEARQLKDAERRKRYEAKLQTEAEKRRQQAEKAKARAEQQRLAEEAKAQKEQAHQEAAANAVILYSPGREPENLRKRLNTLFEKLDDAYPDKKISRLNQDHKKWGETVTELYRLLGYPDGQSFLEAYGYTVEKSAMGRKVSVDPVAIMEELHRRYPNGGAESMDALKNDNPDIPWKTLANNAKEYFGNTLVKHLKSEGIL